MTFMLEMIKQLLKLLQINFRLTDQLITLSLKPCIDAVPSRFWDTFKYTNTKFAIFFCQLMNITYCQN